MLYNTYGAYSFMTAAFGAALGGLIMGSTQLYLMSTCTPWRYRRVCAPSFGHLHSLTYCGFSS